MLNPQYYIVVSNYKESHRLGNIQPALFDTALMHSDYNTRVIDHPTYSFDELPETLQLHEIKLSNKQIISVFQHTPYSRNTIEMNLVPDGYFVHSSLINTNGATKEKIFKILEDCHAQCGIVTQQGTLIPLPDKVAIQKSAIIRLSEDNKLTMMRFSEATPDSGKITKIVWSNT